MTDVDRNDHHLTARLLADDAQTIPVVCRFVPCDQWLITHIDTSWKIKDVKNCILAKCNVWGSSGVPQAPRFRPASPVTFSVPSRRNSFDSGSWGEGSDDDEDDWDVFAYDYNKEMRASDSGMTLDKPPLARITTQDIPTSFSSPSLPATQNETESELVPATRYTLFSFSNGYVFEDDTDVSWYKIRPFELLELHRYNAIVPLPREFSWYIEPYLETPVRVTDRPGPRRPKSSTATPNRDVGAEEQTLPIEWKMRWTIIRDGVLNICKDPSLPPTHRFPLTSLTALYDPVHFGITGKNTSRIICAKFKKRPAANGTNSEASPSLAQNPWHPQDRRKPRPPKTSTWVVMDLPTQCAYDSMLRVLHRLMPPPITSSFVPSSVSVKTRATSPVAPKPVRPSSPVETLSTSNFSVLYPEWRYAVFTLARGAGLGDAGPTMIHCLFSDQGYNPEGEYIYQQLPRSASISEALRKQELGDSERSEMSNTVQSEKDDDAGDGNDDDADVESEVEWDGWMRDLSRQHEAPSKRLSVSSLNTLGRNSIISPSSQPLLPDYENGSLARVRTVSLAHKSKPAMGNQITYSASGARPGRSRSSTVSASTMQKMSHLASAGGIATYTSTTTITTFVDRVPDIPLQYHTAINQSSHRPDPVLRRPLSPTPVSTELGSNDVSENDGRVGGIRRIVRGVSVRSALNADRLTRGFEDALEFVDGSSTFFDLIAILLKRIN